MSFSAEGAEPRFEGRSAAELASSLDLPRVELLASVTSTLDVAHAIAPTAPAGTLIVAEEQTAGRGTQGRRWMSSAGRGIWLALIERVSDPRALEVLSLRCGLFAAEALDLLAAGSIGVKWPNDLYVGGRKLAGVLIEIRWRGATAEWVAIGFGLNVLAPSLDTATGLGPGCKRLDALERLVAALRRAGAATGHLSHDELARWDARDVARGRVVLAPSRGMVDGISAAGELLVRDDTGRRTTHRTGTLSFAEPLTCS